MSTLYVVGIGPGAPEHLTPAARAALERAEAVVGYDTYLDFVRPLIAGKDVVSSGMMQEIDRCTEALRLAAAGKTVSLVSGGDAGIYGMAGLVLELAEREEYAGVAVEVVPAVSAVQAAASVLGAPLMHDFAVISLSDLLTPWDLIERRLVAAAAADFVVALYNPRSKKRVVQLETARTILLAARSSSTPVGIVRNACRAGEEKIVTTLGEMLSQPVDMFSIVIIGNSSSYVDGKGRIITPRGYDRKGKGEGQRAKGKTETVCLQERAGRAIMFGGTGSDVGKSVLAAGFCRLLKNRGVDVAPFKSQNMALNSFVTPDGGEIGRAQAVQAEACRLAPHVDMNPVLLKPNSHTGSQVVVHGRPVGNMSVQEYQRYKPEVFVKVAESLARLRGRHEVVVIEGAGSIAEINLKAADIANMKVAELADCPVILVADIDRGGVFAQIVGTIELLDPAERQRVRGVVINKFRGDPSLLEPGIAAVEERTGVPVVGVVPWFDLPIPGEDSVALRTRGRGATVPDKLNIGVVKLPRLSNYTDFDALETEADVVLHFVDRPEHLDGLDLLILPGTKATIPDLAWLRTAGLAEAVAAFAGRIVGICGGYQMLGRRIADPLGIESAVPVAEGLGLLDVETEMLAEKTTHQAVGVVLPSSLGPDLAGCNVEGYEIHMGATVRGPGAFPFATLTQPGGGGECIDGAVSADGRVFGTYLHGVFDSDALRTGFLNVLRREKGLPPRAAAAATPDPLDLLARHLEEHLDLAVLLPLCGAA